MCDATPGPDRPALENQEIEVTPEMGTVGASFLLKFNLDQDEHAVAAQMFRAMWAAGPCSSSER